MGYVGPQLTQQSTSIRFWLSASAFGLQLLFMFYCPLTLLTIRVLGYLFGRISLFMVALFWTPLFRIMRTHVGRVGSEDVSNLKYVFVHW